MINTRNFFLIAGIIGLTIFGITLRERRNDDNPDSESLFNEYILKFNKTYKPNESEYLIRMENFKKSLNIINELNKNRLNNSSALYGLTAYADMSQDEFREMKLQSNHSSYKLPQKFSSNSAKTKTATDDEKDWKKRHKDKSSTHSQANDVRIKRSIGKLIPVVDWRKKNVIGGVHNQGTCGACWAFSVIETVESMNAIKNGAFSSLSVQQAIDCARNGNYGCEGGDSCALLEWLINTKTNITSEREYPFAYHTQICRPKVSVNGVRVKSSGCYDFVGAEENLLELLANHGPVAAAVNALHWQYYLGGIIQFHCSGLKEDVNHVVQIVGYNNTAPVPYYIVRNSWGTEFGDNGYLYIAIGNNICGVANQISSVYL